MLSTGDNSDPEAIYPNQQVKYAAGKAELAESTQLSLLASGQRRNLRCLVQLIDGRTRSFARTRASRSMSESAVKVAVHRGLKALVVRIGEETKT
jgi:hypothetical protein